MQLDLRCRSRNLDNSVGDDWDSTTEHWLSDLQSPLVCPWLLHPLAKGIAAVGAQAPNARVNLRVPSVVHPHSRGKLSP